MATAGRKPRHNAVKEKTGASVPEGYREWLIRYSERAHSPHEGTSRAIYELCRYDMGARYLMAQIIKEGLSVPEDVKSLVDVFPGDASMVRSLREPKEPYIPDRPTLVDGDDPVLKGGPPTYFKEKMVRVDLMALAGEMAFLSQLSPGKKARSKGLRLVIQELVKYDELARRLMREICDEGVLFIPAYICEMVRR